MQAVHECYTLNPTYLSVRPLGHVCEFVAFVPDVEAVTDAIAVGAASGGKGCVSGDSI